MAHRLVVARRAPHAPPVEVVERKGAGHPDTLCDHLAERLGRHLAGTYVERTGAIRHFNVDKGLLIAGATEVGFGGGTRSRPFRVILAGRADPLGGALPVPELAERVRKDLATALPDAGPDAFEVELRLGATSPDLAGLAVDAGDGPPRANDTSVAVVSLPRSPLEDAVLRVERRLTSGVLRERVPIGPDVKVMAVRTDEAVTMTMAAAVLAPRVADADGYEAAVRAVAAEGADVAGAVLGREVEVTVNAADADHAYLTLSGTSAEAGDDGGVGRGNRFGGLIAPSRPTSMEACAGKNPVGHVGKTYHATAQDIGEAALAEPGVDEVTVTLVSRIGQPVTVPQLVHVAVVGDVDDGRLAGIVHERLADWRGVRDRLLAGHYRLY
ncbi:MAG TPA: methionine adenosyltransferase [Acidimicrobiales bacterium]